VGVVRGKGPSPLFWKKGEKEKEKGKTRRSFSAQGEERGTKRGGIDKKEKEEDRRPPLALEQKRRGEGKKGTEIRMPAEGKKGCQVTNSGRGEKGDRSFPSGEEGRKTDRHRREKKKKKPAISALPAHREGKKRKGGRNLLHLVEKRSQESCV